MLALSISEPKDIHYVEADTICLANGLACMLIYNTFNSAHKRSQPRMFPNIQTIANQLKQEIPLLNVPIKYKFTSKKQYKEHNEIKNIYNAICDDATLRMSLKKCVDLNQLLHVSVDTDANLVHKVMETDRCKCLCGKPLIRKHRYQRNAKGGIGILYTNKGPLTTLHFVWYCPCGAEYYHNKYKYKNELVLEDVSRCIHMNSKSTFVSSMVVEEASNWRQLGMSMESICDNYNDRHMSQIKLIGERLKSLQQQLGNHKTPYPHLNRVRLTEAVDFRRLHMAINDDLDEVAFVSNDTIERFKARKNSEVLFTKKFKKKSQSKPLVIKVAAIIYLWC
eukprot:726315_1